MRTPERGDLIWLSFTPQSGREQAGRRPALVVSPSGYNSKVGLALVCPITSSIKGYPFEVPLPQGGPVQLWGLAVAKAVAETTAIRNSPQIRRRLQSWRGPGPCQAIHPRSRRWASTPVAASNWGQGAKRHQRMEPRKDAKVLNITLNNLKRGT